MGARQPGNYSLEEVIKQPNFKGAVKPHVQTPLQRGPVFDPLIAPLHPMVHQTGLGPAALWGSWVTAKPLQGTPSLAGVCMVPSLVSLQEHPSSALRGHGTCRLSPAPGSFAPFFLFAAHQCHGATLAQLQKMTAAPRNPSGCSTPAGVAAPQGAHSGDRPPHWGFGSTLPRRRELAQGFVLCPVYPAEKNRGVQCAGISRPRPAPLPHESC